MLDFALGFSCGVITVTAIWLMLGKKATRVYIASDDLSTVKVVEEQPSKIRKPDNARAAYFSSPAYRREQKLVEGMKKGAASFPGVNRS